MDLRKNNKGASFLEVFTITLICGLIITFIGGIIYQAVHTVKEDIKCEVKILSINYEPA